MSDERKMLKRKCVEKESSEEEGFASDSTQAGSPPQVMRGTVKRAAAVAANTKLRMAKSSLYEKAYKEDLKRKANEPVIKGEEAEFESLRSPIKGQEKEVLEQMSKTAATLAKTPKMAKKAKRAVIESDGSSTDDALEVVEEVKTGVVVSSDDDGDKEAKEPSKRIVESEGDSDKENLEPSPEKDLSFEAKAEELVPLAAEVKEKAEEVVKQVLDEVAMSDLAVEEQMEELLKHESRGIVAKALLAKKDAEGVAAHIVDELETMGEGKVSLGLLELVRETVVNCLKGIDAGDVWMPKEESANKSEPSAEGEAKIADEKK